MHINANTAISTSKVLLVPYEAQHVPTYHEWMKDPEIQSLTASEPLSLPDEYSMQKSWRSDKDKLTFIICLPLPTPFPSQSPLFSEPPSPSTGKTKISPDAPTNMLGDINLFLTPTDTDTDESTTNTSTNPTTSNICIGEIELMIAPKNARRKGYGRAALLAFLRYLFMNLDGILEEYSGLKGTSSSTSYSTSTSNSGFDSGDVGEGLKSGPVLTDLKRPSLEKLRVKISQENVSSIRLFESVGFGMVDGGRANYFGEVELVLDLGVGLGDGLGGGEEMRIRMDKLLGRWGVEGWREVGWSELRDGRESGVDR